MKKSTIYWIIVLLITNSLWFGYAALQSREALKQKELSETHSGRILQEKAKYDSLYEASQVEINRLEKLAIEQRTIALLLQGELDNMRK